MKILTAASDRDLLSGLSRLLSADGHEVVAAFDGVQAVSAAGAESFDLAILDDC